MATKIRSTVTHRSRLHPLRGRRSFVMRRLVMSLWASSPLQTRYRANRPPRGVFASFEFGMRMDFDDVEYQPKDGDVLPDR